MIRTLSLTFALAVLCAGAWAADEAKPPADEPKPVGGPRPNVERPPRAAAATDPVLSRFNLTADQIAKIDRAFRDDYGKRRDLSKLDPKEAAAKLKAQAEDLKKSIREILTAEQRKKYDLGCTIVEEADKALNEQVGPKLDASAFRAKHTPGSRPPDQGGADDPKAAKPTDPAPAPAPKPVVPEPM